MSRERAHLEEELRDAEAEVSIAEVEAGGKRSLVATNAMLDARNRLPQLRAKVRHIQQELAQVDDRRDEAAAAAAAARAETETRLRAEESGFWFRRFMTTLGIANGAAFAALASGFLQADEKATVALTVANAMTDFAIGMIAAGLVPALLWIERSDTTRPGMVRLANAANVGLALGSALFFILGIGQAVGGVRGMAGG